VNWNEISQRLAQEAEAVAGMLLPNGKRAGPEWVAGSVDGEPGASLKVRIAGNKAGTWKDFAGGKGGDLIDLWAATRTLSLKDAFTDASAYLGISAPKLMAPLKRAYVRLVKPETAKASGRVLAYLTNERKLTPETIEVFKVRATPDDDAIIFPFLRDGELINTKHLKLARDANGKKKTWQAADAEPCLFGWNLIPDDSKSVLITEGELDAMSLFEYGIAALSVNQGAGNHQWIDSDFDRLERFQEIFLWFDNDDAGQKGAREVAARLGLDRCRIVKFRLKDANEALQQGVTIEEIGEALGAAAQIEPEDLRTPNSYVDEVVAMFADGHLDTAGVELPWPAWRDKVRLRSAELSIWTGINSHGKSDVLGHVLLHLVKQGERACLFSGEMKPTMVLYRLASQACATTRPTEGFVRAAHDWLTGGIWLYNHVGSVQQDRLIEAFKYAAKRYRVTHFIVDSLMKCGIDEDDYKGQKAFADRLCDFKNEFGVHVHLVAHARKGESEDRAPGKLDVKGTGAITDLADNVFTVWRNKRKEFSGEAADPTEEDSRLYCHKQRATGYEGILRLWFDPNSRQFSQSATWHPQPYVEFQAT